MQINSMKLLVFNLRRWQLTLEYIDQIYVSDHKEHKGWKYWTVIC